MYHNFGRVQKAILKHLLNNYGYTYLGIGKPVEQLKEYAIEEIERAVGQLIKRGFVKSVSPGFYALTKKEFIL